MRAAHVKRFEIWTVVPETAGVRPSISLYAGETTDDAQTLPDRWFNSVKRLLYHREIVGADLDEIAGVFDHVERVVECMNRAQFAVAAAELDEEGINQLFNFYMEQEADVTETG